MPRMSALTIDVVMRAMSKITDIKVAPKTMDLLSIIIISRAILAMVTDQEVSVQVNITINRPRTIAPVAISITITVLHHTIINITDRPIRATTTIIAITITIALVATITTVTIGIVIPASTITTPHEDSNSSSREAAPIATGKTT